MALLVKKTVHQDPFSLSGCYIMLKPISVYDLVQSGEELIPAPIPVDRGIWKDRADYLANRGTPSVQKLSEISNAFYVEPASAPEDCQGENVNLKFLYWINAQVKAKILEDNPGWTDSDIDIVDL